MLKRICKGGSIPLERIVEGSPLSVESISKGLSCVTEGGVLGGLHVSNDNLHVGEGFVDACLEGILLGDDGCLDFLGSVFINSIRELFFKKLALLLSLDPEVSDVGKELINGFTDGSKSCSVSFLEGIVQLIKELLKSAPCSGELGLESL